MCITRTTAQTTRPCSMPRRRTRSTVRPKSPSHPTMLYCSLFKDDMVGPWVARHGMTSADYQTEFDQQNGRGFYPISVQGGGSGSDTRYAAIFAQRDIPLPRQWHVTGTEVPRSPASTTHADLHAGECGACRAARHRKNGRTKLHARTPGPRTDTASHSHPTASCWRVAARCSSRRRCSRL